MKRFAAALSILFAAVLLGSALPAWAQTAQPTLTGEELYRYGSTTPENLEFSGDCASDTVAFEFSGSALGPYPGTFIETGTATLGAVVAEFDSAGSHYIFREVTALDIQFEIQSPVGNVTGTKSLARGSFYFACITGLVTALNLYGDAGSGALLDYDALIDAPTGEFRDNGTSNRFQVAAVSANSRPGGEPNFIASEGGFVSENTAAIPTGPTSVTVTPTTATNTVGQQHCVTATATDAAGNPTPGYSVYFTVTGTTTGRDKSSGTAVTGTNGQAQFCYTAQFPGADTITAVVDADEDGTAETGEPTGTATKTYVLPVSTPLCEVQIQDGGWITAANGDKASFGGNAKVSQTSEVKGEQVYTDHGPTQPLRMKSTTVLAVVCGTREATIWGTGTLNNNVTVFFRIQVTDGGKGSKGDKYGILLSSGYYSGEQPLRGGNITIVRR
jgi:hypothetical protein